MAAASAALPTGRGASACPHPGRTGADRAAPAPRLRTARDTAAILTAQESRVARLAARGFTNREIGAQLLMSPRTVGHHLEPLPSGRSAGRRGARRTVRPWARARGSPGP
ncbi:response regulator transcription factor [Streptomyces sp. NBC_01352]|uniref:response regulator transcription factor n=1 Tax=Streptomyces sp. NBC_01352 TaxID=2903834 RepID=UPI003FCCD36E